MAYTTPTTRIACLETIEAKLRGGYYQLSFTYSHYSMVCVGSASLFARENYACGNCVNTSSFLFNSFLLQVLFENRIGRQRQFFFSYTIDNLQCAINLTVTSCFFFYSHRYQWHSSILIQNTCVFVM